MRSLSFEYWHALAGQLIVIASLLCGFSLSLIFTLTKEIGTKISKITFCGTVVSTSAFLISIFAFTKILLLATNGAPIKASENLLNYPRIIGGLAFILGMISTIFVISLSGWNSQGKTKWFALITAIITFILIITLF